MRKVSRKGTLANALDWDLVIIGAGILGSSHTYFAARRGWRGLLLERGDWPGDLNDILDFRVEA